MYAARLDSMAAAHSLLLLCDYCGREGCVKCSEMNPRPKGLQCMDCWYGQDDDDADSDDRISDTESSDSEISEQPDSSDFEEDEGNKAAEVVAQATRGRKASGSLQDGVWQHAMTKTLHLAKGDHLGCGRKQEFPFTRLPEMPAIDWPRCKGCFGTLQQIEIDDE